MSSMPDLSFGSNWGSQVGQNYGTINNALYRPGKVELISASSQKGRANIPNPRNTPQAVHVDPLLPRPGVCRPRRFSRPDRTDMLETALSRGSRGPGRGRQVAARHRVHAPNQRGAGEPVDLLGTRRHAGARGRGLRAIADSVKLEGRNQPKADIPQLVYNWLSGKRTADGSWC